ncbi:MAG TPA: hypothetical protein VJ438_02290, partial [Candidatus Nanoarchaeia archaeon]|nr:hypothetical protein [Candidatus Nanoarchaeia archaeon]
NIYEKESDGNISNKGTASVSLLINQVPTSLEINLEKPVEPGNNLKVTAILHDQTGEKIISDAVITIKNEKSKIIEQRDVQTDELIEIPVAYNQPPNEWIIIIKSEGLSTEEKFNISQKEAVKINVINSTVIITNIGNVVYNKTTIVKIGNNTINLDICLPIDGVQKYYLSAPEGEYDLEIRAGDEKLNERVMLTGNAVAVEKISDGIISRIAYPLVWMFIIGVLGLVAYLIYKKGYKKAFFGYITKKREERQQATKTTDKSLISTKNKAELSLSIKGEQQNISIACIKLKNETELVKNDAVKEKLNEITRIAEDSKASVYENQNNIFYMWVPLNTKTFKNQNTAIEISQKIKESLDKYNKLAKQKIDFGISLNYGTIVAKKEKDVLKFMSMGTLITTAKKIASISQGEILLSEKMNDKVVVEVKTEKHEKDKIPVYSIKEVRQRGEDTKKFISDFIKRLESDKKAKEK